MYQHGDQDVVCWSKRMISHENTSKGPTVGVPLDVNVMSNIMAAELRNTIEGEILSKIGWSGDLAVGQLDPLQFALSDEQQQWIETNQTCITCFEQQGGMVGITFFKVDDAVRFSLTFL
jgi:hypothetical protein